MRRFAFTAVALLAVAFVAVQAQEADVETQGLRTVKTASGANITLATINRQLRGIANLTSITTATLSQTLGRVAAANGGRTQNNTVAIVDATTIRVTFSTARGGFAFVTLTGPGSLTLRRANKFASASNGTVTVIIRVDQTTARVNAASDVSAEGNLIAISRAFTTVGAAYTVTVADANAARPATARQLLSFGTVRRAPRNATAAVSADGQTLTITPAVKRNGNPDISTLVLVNGVFNGALPNPFNITRPNVPTPANRTELATVKLTLTGVPRGL